MEKTKEQFVRFIRKAMNKHTDEHVELYQFLVRCFTRADQDLDGKVLPSTYP